MTRTYSKEQLDAMITEGLSGPAGPASYTTTTASFTQPASAATVSVTVGTTAWMATGQVLYANGGGYYSVSSVTDATHVILTNLGYTGNASPGATVASGAKVTAGGVQGATGAAGGVTSWNARAGAVVPASGDYSYSQISSAPAIASQAQADAGTDDATIMTPLKSASASMLRINPTEVSIIGATTLTSTAFGKMHVCSGTSANYTVGLPAVSGNVGKVIGFRGAPGLTKLVTVDANASETINGSLTIVLKANDSKLLLCTGTEWVVVTQAGPRYKVLLEYAPVTDFVNGLSTPNNTWTDMHTAQSFTVEDPNSLIEVYVIGNCVNSAAIEVSAAIILDSDAATRRLFGGGFSAPNYLAGGGFAVYSGLSAGSHTVKTQLNSAGAATAYCRVATVPNVEGYRLTVIERRI